MLTNCAECGKLISKGNGSYALGFYECRCGWKIELSPPSITAVATFAHEMDDVIKPSTLRWLPIAFYIIACLGFLGWIIIALNLKSWEAFGYGIGSTIACLASGRLIELVQNIDDELYRKRMSESP